MNEDLAAAAKFKRIATIIFIVFFSLTLILIPAFAFLFDNYWLLFGIAFSFLGYVVKNLKPEKIFFVITIAIIIYWFKVGFHFSDPITFFWFSFLFGGIFKAIVIGYDDLAKKIIDMKASDMTSQIISGIKYRQKTMGEDKDDE
ncbi:MAG: hypothetical protein ABIP35_14725 [Ginsengibacter sp.]